MKNLIYNGDFENLLTEDKERRQGYIEAAGAAAKKLKQTLTPEQWDIFLQYCEASDGQALIEIDEAYRDGWKDREL